MRPSKLRLPESTAHDRQVLARRSRLRSPAAAGRSCRCRSCSRSRPGRTERVEVRASGRPSPGSRSPPRARRERGLHPRPARQAPLHRVPGEQAGADHHARVGGVGAAGDRRDHDRAVVQLESSRPRASPRPRRRCRARVARAPPTAGRGPRSSSWSSAGGSEAGNDSSIASSRPFRAARQPRVELAMACGRSPWPGQRHPVLGPLRPGDARLDRRRGPAPASPRRPGPRRARLVEHPLLAGVGLDQLDVSVGPPGQPQVAQRLGVDREDRAGRAELRRHVADRRPVGQRQRRQPGPVELDELADDAVLAQHLGHGEHEVGGGRALAAARRRA